MSDISDILDIKNHWHAPCYAIDNFRYLVEKIGVRKAFGRKRELEAYVTALTLLAVNHNEGEPWWLQVPDKDPPDVLAGYWFKRKNGQGELAIQEIEVFRIEDYTKEKISEATQRKLNSKFYPFKTVLIGLINRDEEIANLRVIAEEIQRTKPTVSSIWFVGNVDDVSQSTYLIFQVHPILKIYKVNVDKECLRLKKHGHLMRTSRSTKEGVAIKSSIARDDFPLLIPDGYY